MYKQFLRLGLRAVEHKYPQKFILQKVLRNRFEQAAVAPAATAAQIHNTLQFFHAAADRDGLERRCIITLLHYHASKYNHRRGHAKKIRKELSFNDEFMAAIIRGVNETQDMCL